MTEEESQNLSELTGKEFYNSIEKQYGKNAGKVFRYHAIDCCYLLARVEERDIIGVLEEPNNEYSANELTALKKDLCNFIHEKVSLKVGTKAKTIILLHRTRDCCRKRKVQTLPESNSMNSLNHKRYLLLPTILKIPKPVQQNYL